MSLTRKLLSKQGTPPVVKNILYGWGADAGFGTFDPPNRLPGWLAGGTFVGGRSSPVVISTKSWTSIGAFDKGWFGIDTDGSLWARGTDHRYAVATDAYSWSQISAGSSQVLAVRSDGMLFAWGPNDTQGYLIPQSVAGVALSYSSPVQISTSSWSSVAAGMSTQFAIRSDGALFAWGTNSHGQVGIGSTTGNISSPSVVAAGTSWTLISASARSAAAIRNDGTMWAWGSNDQGQIPGLTTTLYSWIQVTTGTAAPAVLAIRSDYTLWAWGLNSSGQLGLNDLVHRSSPVQVGTSSWTNVQLAAGNSGGHAIALRSDNTLWVWGLNSSGQLGLNDLVHRSSPVQVGTSSWTSISAGQDYTMAIRSDGTMWGWGANAAGSLGETNGTQQSWTLIAPNQSLSGPNAAIRSDGALFAWGLNSSGQLGLNDLVTRSSPVQVGTSSWTAVAVGISHTVAIRSDGALFAWGLNSSGQLGLNDLVHRSSPVQVGTSSWTSVASSRSYTAAIRSDGALFAWGLNSSGQLGLNDLVHRSSPVQVGTSSWSQVDTGLEYTVAIRSDGAIFTWGSNNSGYLGLNDLVHRSSPVQVGTSSWTLVSAGSIHTVARRTDGTLWAWGSNSAGQLGEENPTISWAQIVGVADTHVAAIDTAGGLYTWGAGGVGQLGLNSITAAVIPTKVGTSSWSMVSVGSSHTAAIRSDGGLFTWGLNNVLGELGLNNTINRSSPVQVGTSSWTSVSAGTGYTLAIRSDGGLFAWGGGGAGNQGQSDTINRSSPVQVGTSSWMFVTAGRAGFPSTAAIRSDGALFTWGWGLHGQLGLNTTFNTSSPVQVGTSSWTTVACGASAMAAIRSDGALFTWGDNAWGQLADGMSFSRSSPVQIGTNSWVSVYGTLLGTFAAKRSDGTIWGWGYAPDQFGAQLLQPASHLNDGTYGHRSSPVQIGTSSWAQISVHLSTMGAIKSDSLLYTWGTALTNPTLGDELGTTLVSRSSPVLVGAGGLTIHRSSPVQVNAGSSGWSHVSAGNSFTVAVKTDGSLWQWGDVSASLHRQNISRSTPAQVPYDEFLVNRSYTAAYAGAGLTWAKATNGLVYTGGLNNISGQEQYDGTGPSPARTNILTTFGNNGVRIHRSSPVQIGTDSWSVVSAGQLYTLAIRSDGTLWSTGLSSGLGLLGLPNFYASASDVFSRNRSAFTQISTSSWSAVDAGASQALALRSDSRLFAWGVAAGSGILGTGETIGREQSWTQVAVPPGGNYTNTQWTIAIRSDGKLFTWGQNNTGQLGSRNAANASSPIQIGTDNWSKVSAGITHAMAIRSDGALFVWGGNTNGQLGQSDVINRSSPVQIGTSSWTQISGSNMSAAIRSDGALFTWGLNDVGQQGQNDRTHRSSPVQVGTSSWTQLSVGGNPTGAIRSDGGLFMWGGNTGGGLGLNDQAHRSSPVQVGTSSWSFVSAGVSTAAAIRSDGALFMWGINSSGELGDGTVISRSSPVQVGTSSWLAVSAGLNWTVAVRSDYTLWAWGYNNGGVHGTFTAQDYRSSPVQITSGAAPASWLSVVAGGTYTTTAIASDNTLWMWGENSIGAHGHFTPSYRSSPVIVAPWVTSTFSRSSPTQIGVLSSSWTAIAASKNSTGGIAIRKDGAMFVWGNAGSYTLGFPNNAAVDRPTQVVHLPSDTGYNVPTDRSFDIRSKFTQVSLNSNVAGYIRSDGILVMQGSGIHGIHGRNTRIDTFWPMVLGGLQPWAETPVQIGVGSSWTQVNAAGAQLHAIRTDGALFAAGSNLTGALGQNDTIHRSSLVQVGTSSWTMVKGSGVNLAFIGGDSIGRGTTLAIRSDGGLFAWGENTEGQLGQNDRVHRSSPVQIGTSSWSFVDLRKTAGTYYTAAIRSDGTLWGWGVNPQNFGRETGTTIDTWTTVDGGISAAAAIRSDGALFTWGINTAGQLGDNSSIHRSSPVQIGANSWTSISIGQSHMMAIRSDGALFGWGTNSFGELGLNNVVARSSPVQIGTSSWASVSCGPSSTAAIRGDGALFMWGNNSQGQLGDNTTILRSSPVQIGTSSWSLVSACFSHTVAIRSDGTLWAWGYNSDGTLGLNDRVHRSSPVQIGTSSWTTVSAGGVSTTDQTFAIRTDGGLFAWGVSGTLGILGLNDISINRSSPTQIGSSSWTTVVNKFAQRPFAIRSDGVLFAWGATTQSKGDNASVFRSSPVQVISNSRGGFGDSGWTLPNFTKVTVKKVAVTSPASFIIDQSDHIYVWGDFTSTTFPTFGLGFPPSATPSSTTLSPVRLGGAASDTSGAGRSSPVMISSSSWNQVAVLNNDIVGIRTNYTLWAWGESRAGVSGSPFRRSSPVQIGGSSTVDSYQLSSGDTTKLGDASWTVIPQNPQPPGHFLAIRSDGTLWGWGLQSFGETGATPPYSHVANIFSPTQVGTSSWTAVGIGTGWSAAIRQDGGLFTWGWNDVGQQGQNDRTHRSSPVQVGTSSWIFVSAIEKRGAAIRSDGGLFIWGQNLASGPLGLNDTAHRSSPVQIGTSSWTSVSLGISHTAAIRSDGTLWTWGDATGGKLGDTGGLLARSYNTIGSHGRGGFAITPTGQLFSWGRNENGQLGQNDVINRSSPVQIGTSSWAFVSAGGSAAAAIRSDGALFTWGTNTSGQLGQNNTIHRSSPVQVGTSSWTSVSIGGSHMAAIRSDGALFMWGTNTSGQLGQNNTIHRSSPVQVGTSSWTSVSVGGNVTFAIRTDGGLFVWGSQSFGNHGLNDAVSNRSSPVQIGTSSWSQIAIGIPGLAAIRSDGALFTWGLNSSGELGQNNTINTSSPIQVGTSSWTTAAAGQNIVFAIRTDGALYGWGAGTDAQLGDGTLISRSSPVLVGVSGKSWLSVGGSEFSARALDTSKLLWTWGSNLYGDGGTGIAGAFAAQSSPVLVAPLGLLINRSSPVQVGLDRSWMAVSAGSTKTIARSTDGTLWAWGLNISGSLGDNTTTHRSSLVQIGTSNKWQSISSGSGSWFSIGLLQQ